MRRGWYADAPLYSVFKSLAALQRNIPPSWRRLDAPNQKSDNSGKRIRTTVHRNIEICLFQLALQYKKTHAGSNFLQLTSFCILRNYVPPANRYSDKKLFPQFLVDINTALQRVMAIIASAEIRNLPTDSTTLPLICYRKLLLANINYLDPRHKLYTSPRNQTLKNTEAN